MLRLRASGGAPMPAAVGDAHWEASLLLRCFAGVRACVGRDADEVRFLAWRLRCADGRAGRTPVMRWGRY